jgi:hypothetical protein
MFLKFEHSDLAISEVSYYGFLRGHSSISQLTDLTVGFKKKVQNNIIKGCFEAVLSLKSSKNFRGYCFELARFMNKDKGQFC